MLNILTLRLHVHLFHPFLSTKGGLDEHASDVGNVLDYRDYLLDLRAVFIEEFVDLLDEVESVLVRYDAFEILELYGFVLDLVKVLSCNVILLHL